MAIEQTGKPSSKWAVEQSEELYRIGNWGQGFFRINRKGMVTVHPDRDAARSVALMELIEELDEREVYPPILFRFGGILRQRLEDIQNAFEKARKENAYNGDYCCIYPIKVNQQRHVVEEYMGFAKQYGYGIEAGSKPELLAILAISDDQNTPIICNGFKDDEYIETVILARKIGKRIIPVVEKFTELELIVKYAQMHNVMPEIGVRLKLAAKGSGRWENSAGVLSKFGLTIPEIIRALHYLRERSMEKCLSLLHFHMGSQITNISSIKSALSEAARVYAELYRAGAGMKYMDVGGGLGVDYDGSQTNSESSMNYSLQEYANDVVYRIKKVVEDAGVPHPTIMTESGRATMAYNSVLVMNVLGTASFDAFETPVAKDPSTPEILKTLREIYDTITLKNYQESYHDAMHYRDETVNGFNAGTVSLELRSQVESLFWGICRKTRDIVAKLDYAPDEFRGLGEFLRDTYFCNFSVFQSCPDSWAIDQLFPIMPIHRLNEKPTRAAVLADITCDSDGKIEHFIDLHDVSKTIDLHVYTGQPYYIGVFLIGAYQEILGDLHNLFGDTNAVHISLDEKGDYQIDHVVEGDTVTEVLSYVQFDVPALEERMRREVETAMEAGRITPEEKDTFLNFYLHGMEGYTYLEEPTVTASMLTQPKD